MNELMIIGEVTKVTLKKANSKVQNREKRKQDMKIVEVVILQNLNKKLKKRKIKLITGTAISSCGYPFEERLTYLITLSKEKNGLTKGVKYATSICLPNKLLKDLSSKERELIEEMESKL